MKKRKKVYEMKLNKKEMQKKINTCLINGGYEQVEILEKALGLFNLAPWYGESGLCEKVIEVK